MFYCYVEPLSRVFIRVIEIIVIVFTSTFGPSTTHIYWHTLLKCRHRNLIDSVPQIKDAKGRRIIAERYLTPTYRRVSDRVNANPPELTEQDKSAIAVDKSFQKKCPKDVSL